jgi:peroxiredoxin
MLQAEIGSGKVTAAESPPTRGHLMPDFTMSSSDGRQVSLYDYRGRSNLVLFLPVAHRTQPKTLCLALCLSATGRSLIRIRRP